MAIFQSAWPQLISLYWPVKFSYSIDSTLLGSTLFYSPKLFMFSISHNFKPSAVHTWLLEIALVHALVCVFVCVCMCVCVSVCPPPRVLITSGVIWCDIGHMQLVKQVLRLSPAFNYFIWHLPSIEWMGVAILIQHVVNAYQRKLKWRGTSYKRTTQKTERFIYKNEWANV